MKKILILGSGGAGKSTLARRLGKITGIEVVHLDKIYWKPDWTEPDDDEWVKINKQHLEKDAWIMDGNFGSTLEMRLKKADTVLFLDFPRTICVYRALKRLLRYRGANRPDMGAGCIEKFDWKFLKWIWNFSKKDKPRVEKLVSKYNSQARTIRLSSNREVELFIEETARN